MSAFDEALKAPLLTLTERDNNKNNRNKSHRRIGSDSSTTSTLSTASSSLPPVQILKNNRSSSSASRKSKKKYPTKGRGSRQPIKTPPKQCFDLTHNLQQNDNDDQDHLLTPTELQKLESGAIDSNIAIAHERHVEISSLTLDMQQIRTIQTDLAGIIDDQQVGIDDIEYCLSKTRSRVDKGVDELEKASTIQRRRQIAEKVVLIVGSVFAVIVVIFYFYLHLK